ncbi:MAG: efflux RND transporter permease subunit [Cyanobacteria bacterium P01_D01_bin.116]
MWNLFYRNTRLLTLTISLILVWGFSSFQMLPRMEDPALSQWYAIVNTRFPGASAQRVESLVTDKIEQELSEIKEIKRLASVSKLGSSTLGIKLEESVQNHDEVWSKVRDRLSDVIPKLPQEANLPQYEEIGNSNTLIISLSWDLNSPPNYNILNRHAKELESELRTLTGTDKVELVGIPNSEILVEINPDSLSALGLTPQTLSQQINESDAKVSSGQLYSPRNNLLMEVETELDSVERIRQIPIKINDSGQFSRLGDIALIQKSIQQPPTESAIINGKPAIAVAVLMNSETRIDQWRKQNLKVLEQFKSKLPDGITLQIIFDQSYYVNNQLNNLFKNLILGAVCVIVATIFMMGWKSAVIVASSLPLCVLMVFGSMRLLSIPLHQISVTGLVIALGLLIDNAIVIVDEMQGLLKAGYQPSQAISKSVSYLAVPLLASTLTTVFTFTPIILLPGNQGEFMRSLGLSVILSLLSSLFLSLTVIPALTGLAFKGNLVSVKQRRWWNTGFSQPNLTRLYQRCLNSILLKPILGVTLALILPITGFVVADNIPEQFFPPAERDQFYINLELPDSASLKETQLIALQAREIILNRSEVTNVHWFFSRNAPSFYYNMHQDRKNSPNYAQALVQLKSAEYSRQEIRTIQKELDRAFPSVRFLAKQLEQGNAVDAPIELHIYGSNLDILEQLGQQVREILAQINDVTHTKTSMGGALPKLGLRLDEEQARLVGLNNTEIARQLDANLEGIVGGSILEGTEELPIRVRLSNQKRADLEQIASLNLIPNNPNQNSNSQVPLSTVSKIKLLPELSTITRRYGKRVNTIQGFITAGVLPSKILTNFKQQLQESNFKLPPGYKMEFGGESSSRNEAIANLMSTVGVLIILMLATLVLSFSSFRSAFIIAVVGFCSVGLGLFSLWIFGYPLGFMAILGTVSLIGVAINDSIVILAALQADFQASIGNIKAICQVVFRSTRHVLTTTITTVAGFIPLLIDGGEFWPPLAICVAGGVIGATLLALLFVPCAYLLMLGLPLSTKYKYSLKKDTALLYSQGER